LLRFARNDEKGVFYKAFYGLIFGGMLWICGCAGPGRTTSINIKDLVPQAEETIGECLTDVNPQLRANAVETVAVTRLSAFMPQVQQLLRDDFVPVRFAAALAIGDMRYRPAKDIIGRLMTNDPDTNVKIAAAYAMSRLGRPESLELVRKAVMSKDQTLRANAVVLLGKSGDKSSLELLSWALSDKDSDDKVRFQAVEAMARLGDEKIFHKLWAIVLSSYADDRIMGIRAMGALGTEKAKEVLITKLDDEVLEVRLAAAEQLGMLNDKTGENEVVKVFEKNLTFDMDNEERQRANVLTAMAIGQIKTASVTRFLPQMLKDSSKFVRIAAARAVIQCAD
jgi:HEAT repeat protein